jgi:predicted DNA-binding WGR domain protein
MNARRFEFTSETSNKFWEIWTSGPDVWTRWGRIGTAGNETLVSDGGEDAAQKLIKQKLKKGYAEV